MILRSFSCLFHTQWECSDLFSSSEITLTWSDPQFAANSSIQASACSVSMHLAARFVLIQEWASCMDTPNLPKGNWFLLLAGQVDSQDRFRHCQYKRQSCCASTWSEERSFLQHGYLSISELELFTKSQGGSPREGRFAEGWIGKGSQLMLFEGMARADRYFFEETRDL